MAEPASHEAASSTVQPSAPSANATAHDSPPVSRPPSAMTMGFQAVNARAVSENERASTAASAPPQPAVAEELRQPSQVSHSSSQAPSPPVRNQAAASQHDNSDAAADAATYGTRSRNRTGNNRVNYAEDQEMEGLEYTITTASKRKSAPGNSNAASEAAEEAKRDQQQFARFIAVNTAPNLSPAHTAKESTPSSGTGPVATGKKRKAAAASAAATPPTSNSPLAGAARKPGAAAASSTFARETNLMTFTKSKACLNKRGELVADDGAKLSVNDHVYLVCEPPGDPYYLCRIMEFLHVQSDISNPVEALRVNWYYRPRDVQRFNSDSRLVYGTMHSDICPLSSLRGKCTIKHRSEIEDLEAYRKERDSFYFVQIFDRFIRRWYECIPVAQIINVPDKVKKVLDERWKFVVVEIGRVKELTSAVKTCKRCAKYCASHDSVDCAICKHSYHMNCVQPPLPKKPSRGFAWACGPCSRASERQQELRNTPNASGEVTEAEEEVPEDEEMADPSNGNTRAPSPSGSDIVVDDHPATQAEIALAKMWPMRYLGIHARVEDALQYDDRAIYPRASTRLGPRHQANVNVWHGRPVELVKPAEIKKRYQKGHAKTQAKMTKEAQAAIEADREEKAKRPKWVQDEPPGYVARGEDYPNDDPRCTAKLLFKMPDEPPAGSLDHAGTPIQHSEQFIKDYQRRCKQYARGIGVPPFGVNFIDKSMELLVANKYNVEAALKQLQKVDRVKDLHEPVLTKAELSKFEEGVAKYGSEHRLIRLHMKTNLPNSDIVRFYYLWKKTPKGKEIWGNYGGRKGSKRKVESDTGSRLQSEVAHDVDDSAFDNEKAVRKNRSFQCKFCNTHHSRQWRKAPGVSPGQTITVSTADKSGNKEKKDKHLLALCLRCAGLWRKYAIQWEDIDEVAKKVAQGGGRAWKKRIDEELLRELVAANEAASMPQEAVPSIENGEPPKKKSRMDEGKKREKPPPPPKEPTPPPPPIVPAQPTWRVLPCSVCRTTGDTIACDHCKLTVHRRCYGMGENEGIRSDGTVKWVCDQCQNDRNPSVSTDYSCCLCLTEETIIDLVEPPKISHKKKTDREREKERLEKELADNMRNEYRLKQMSMNRPVFPREPLKRTTGNNWVHVYCAVWTPEIRFSNAKALEVAEGFQGIPPARHEAICKLCKNKDHHNRVRHDAGACVSCFQCGSNVHASCAFEAGYLFGFDVTPVKGSRKDQVTTARLGDESGALTAGIWCKEHVVKTPVHPMHEIADETGRSALQVYVESYKQADLALTGTVRKANLAQLTKEKAGQVATANNGPRRESTVNSIAAAVRRGARNSSLAETRSEPDDTRDNSTSPDDHTDLHCIKCNIDVTPKWHPVASPVVKAEGSELFSSRPTGDNERPSLTDITGAPTGPNGRSWDRAESEQRDGDGNGNGEGFHSHGLPRFGNAESAPSKPEEANPPVDASEARNFLCHKCFLKKKLAPTPPPSERPVPPPPVSYSSPHQQYTGPMDWSRPPTGPGQPVYASVPHRSPWDDPRGHPPAHGPPMNGMPPASGYGVPPGQHPPQFGAPPPGYAGQLNGYGAPPPPGGPGSAPHGGPQQIHDRHPSYGYGPPAHPGAHPYPPPAPQHAPPQPPRGPPMNGYSQPANGMPSPHAQHPSMHSPPTPYGAQPHQQSYPAPPRPGENHYPGPPNNNSHPGYPGPQPQVSPSVGQARPEGYPPGRPMTPRGEGQANGGQVPGPGGASASPSLRHLLH